jgi:hypothetical protein
VVAAERAQRSASGQIPPASEEENKNDDDEDGKEGGCGEEVV